MPNAMYGLGEHNIGVVLYDDISETALAALLDISALNLTHIDTLAPERTYIRSR